MLTSSTIIESLRSHRLVDGLTHSLYNYPARFSPDLTKEIVNRYSLPGDWVFDPFMGGGTCMVQSLAMGRNALGVDINSLAYLVAQIKTTPVNKNDVSEVQDWINVARKNPRTEIASLEILELKKHFPKHLLHFIDSLLEGVANLSTVRARRLARFVMLLVYQTHLNDRDRFPSYYEVKRRMQTEFDRIVLGLSKFENSCLEAGTTKAQLSARKKLLNKGVTGIEADLRIARLIGQPKLVFTSPPYPGVHVLYNKWQIASRKETSLPYYIGGIKDSLPSSGYTLGGRSKTGISEYFDLITSAFNSVAKVAHPNALIVQLIGFSNVRVQLSRYLEAMERAGYREEFPLTILRKRLWREVPNRKWYSSSREWDASREVLLFHRLA
ncbi:MAG: DNA methyltransferase [Anaerolineales bacterium]